MFTIRSLSVGGAAFLGCLAIALTAGAQVNGVGQNPYLGWSSFSQQTLDANFLTQANIQAQSDAMASSGLQAHGFNYINIDSGWQGSFDGNGRPIPNPTTFPDIAALVAHIHANGQKAGIYWIPGVEEPAVAANSPILGTPYHIQDILTVPYTAGNAFGAPGTSPYHYKINFSKRGAQAYINSVVALFASWGIDYIKLDGVTPGSDVDNLSIDNRQDVAAWSQAIAAGGRPMWLTLSWDLDQDYLSVWQQYGNARRIEDDIECEGRCSTLTDWQRIYERFRDVVGWEHDAGPTVGWNDLDSLDIGDGALDGLTDDEKQTAVTLWALADAPITLGGDLTKIDSEGLLLSTNDEVLAVQQSGHPAIQVLGGRTPVWIADAGDGSYYVGIFNLDDVTANVRVRWSEIGLSGGASVRDVWNHIELGSAPIGFTSTLPGHGSRLLKVQAEDFADPAGAGTVYEAEAATLSGSAVIADCPACSGGEKVGGLGLGAANTVTFENVNAPRSGTYLMEVDSMTQGLRSYQYTVNDGTPYTLDTGGGSFFLPSSTTVPVQLHAGMNAIGFGSPTSYPPDLDRIIVRGDGAAPVPAARTYEAEAATLNGTVTAGFCNYCSGLSYAGNIGGGAGNDVIFGNVDVPVSGMYQLEIDYATSGPRSFYVTVNGGSATVLDLNGSTFSEPQSTTMPVALHAGANTIAIGNPDGYSPNLDRIVIAPMASSPELSASLSRQIGVSGLALLKLTLTNNGTGTATHLHIGDFSFTQTAGTHACTPRAGQPLPIRLGNLPPTRSTSFLLPVSFLGCDADAEFTLGLSYSANQGADAGMTSINSVGANGKAR